MEIQSNTTHFEHIHTHTHPHLPRFYFHVDFSRHKLNTISYNNMGWFFATFLVYNVWAKGNRQLAYIVRRLFIIIPVRKRARRRCDHFIFPLGSLHITHSTPLYTVVTFMHETFSHIIVKTNEAHLWKERKSFLWHRAIFIPLELQKWNQNRLDLTIFW